jgi:zinc protease
MPLRILVLLFFALPLYGYDLSEVTADHLSNGLTVMILEDHAQPLVSTQVLYKVGGRNECTGATGLAHFVEHMSFRATKNFPDTQDAIYAVGGEWHGYTWIDQTTYFETVPVKHLDTVLRLQADRMTNVLNRTEEVEAERGAVLTELHSYENDPATVLYDQVLAVSFLEHPYRFNTIGWTSDVEKITHDDIVAFYHRYYTPSNAVLAIAGDVQREKILQDVRKYFGAIPSKRVESLPRTVEPLQTGQRRVYLHGSSKLNYYQISYHAPAANDPDFAPFLLLQAVLAGSNGVSFRQSGFAVDVPEGTRLYGIGKRISTFFPPTAQSYIFNIAGQAESKPEQIENQIEKQIAQVREKLIDQKELQQARTQFLAELVFDIETTEDAAHQMAYFEGIGAFSTLQKLPDLVNSVTPADIQRVAQKYLKPQQRTIGWYLEEGAGSVAAPRASAAALKDSRESVRGVQKDAARPIVTKLKGGITLIVKKLTRTPAGFLRILIPSNNLESLPDSTSNKPVWGFTSLHWRFLKQDFATAIEKARKALKQIKPGPATELESMDDPEARLDAELERAIGANPVSATLRPAVICVVGDVDANRTIEALTKAFNQQPGTRPNVRLQPRGDKTVKLPGKAQSQFGYAALAPPPSSAESYAYRALVYVMTHGYGGRLGKELINRRGLIYYIGNDYHSDGNASWISIRFGVNPDKLVETRSEFQKLMNNLLENPPTGRELSEAKEHLIGRRITAYQSNEELSGFYAREWIEQQRLLTQTEFENKVNAVTLQQIKAIIPKFLKGVSVTVDTN